MDGTKYTPVVIDGVQYNNPAEAAELLGFSRNTIYKYLQSRPNETFKDALLHYIAIKDGTAAAGMDSPREVVYKGVKYKSAADACKKLGLNAPNIYYRMRAHGVDFETAANYDKSKTSRVTQTTGESDSPLQINLMQYCLKNDLSYPRMYRNVAVLGMTVEEAEKKVRGRENTRVYAEYNGVKYSSLAKACRMLGLPYNDIYNIMRRKKLNLEEAINYLYEHQ